MTNPPVEPIPSFVDAVEAQKAADDLRHARVLRKRFLLGCLMVLGAFLLTWMTIRTLVPYFQYRQAESLYLSGKLLESADAFSSLGNWSDAAERARISRYAAGQQALREGRLEDAEEAFILLGDWQDAPEQLLAVIYARGSQLLRSGAYASAAACFHDISGYMDTESLEAEAWYGEGLRLLQEGAFAQSALAFSRAGMYRDALFQLQNACGQEIRKAVRLKDPSALSSALTLSDTCGVVFPDFDPEIGNDIYQAGLCLMEEKAYREAAAFFDAAGSYENSEMLSSWCRARSDTEEELR